MLFNDAWPQYGHSASYTISILASKATYASIEINNSIVQIY